MQSSNETTAKIPSSVDEWTEKQELVAYFCCRNNYHKSQPEIIKLLALQNNLTTKDLKNRCKNYDFLFGEKGDNNCSKQTIKVFVKYHDLTDKKIIEILTDKGKIERKIKDLEELSKYDFNKAEVLECQLDKKKINAYNLHQLLNQIYLRINDPKQIIKSSVIKIYPNKVFNKDFTYLKSSKISVEKTEMNQTLLEIIHQCKNNDMKLRIKVKIDDEILNLNFS